MIPEELEKLVAEAVQNGKKPFFVNTMAGTTVYGSYEDYVAIHAIAKKYDMWMHVDGCWGGFLYMVPELR